MSTPQVAWYAVLFVTAMVSGAEGAQDGTIRVNTKLVQISVVVREKNGPVAGLTREDFTVTDNGKAQRIDVFSASDSRNRKQTTLGTMPAGLASNMMNAVGEVPQSATVILFDMM